MYAEGAYSVVFFDEEGYAIKVFKQRTEAPEEHLQKVFQSEVDAYTIASQHQELRRFVPKFFGKLECEKIFDINGCDISHQFYLKLVYKMEKVDGTFRKCGLQDEYLISVFNSAGIRHTKDASVLFHDDAVKCVVDIATQEYELYWH